MESSLSEGANNSTTTMTTTEPEDTAGQRPASLLNNHDNKGAKRKFSSIDANAVSATLQHLSIVLSSTDPSEPSVLQSKPAEQHNNQSSPTKSPTSKLENGTKQQETKTDHLSIADKFQRNAYKSLAELETDFRSAVGQVLSNLAVNNAQYSIIDQYSRFALQLIKREEVRILGSEENNQSNGTRSNGDLSKLERTGKEILYIMCQNGPLFTSFSRLSPYDPRRINASGNFYTSKVIPLAQSNPASSLAEISPVMINPRNPINGLYEVDLKVPHPCNARLPATKWLDYGPYSSFGPTRDEGSVIIDNVSSGAVWFEKYGRKALSQSLSEEEQVEEGQRDSKSSEPAETKEEDISKSPLPVQEKSETGKDQETTADGEIVTAMNNNNTQEEDIKEEYVLSFDPSTTPIDFDEVDKEEAEMDDLELTSKWLLELQDHQKKRLLLPRPHNSYASQVELKLANKIRKHLATLVDTVPPQFVADNLSSKIPVPVFNYNGTLPVAETPRPVSTQTTGRGRFHTPGR